MYQYLEKDSFNMRKDKKKGQPKPVKSEVPAHVQEPHDFAGWIDYRSPVPTLGYVAQLRKYTVSDVMLPQDTMQLQTQSEMEQIKYFALFTFLKQHDVQVDNDEVQRIYNALKSQIMVWIPKYGYWIRRWGMSFRIFDADKKCVTKTAKAHKDVFSSLVRPNFSSNIRQALPTGNGLHRRHIISFDIMKSAFQRVLDNIQNEKQCKYFIWLFSQYFKIPELLGEKELCQVAYYVANVVLKVMNNREENLVVDTGSENSALGVLAYRIQEYLSVSQEQREEGFLGLGEQMTNFSRLLTEFIVIPNENSAVWGICQNVYNTYSVYYENECEKIKEGVAQGGIDPNDAIRWMFTLWEDIIKNVYDNVQFDVMTHVSDPEKVGVALSNHYYEAFCQAENMVSLCRCCIAFCQGVPVDEIAVMEST